MLISSIFQHFSIYIILCYIGTFFQPLNAVSFSLRENLVRHSTLASGFFMFHGGLIFVGVYPLYGGKADQGSLLWVCNEAYYKNIDRRRVNFDDHDWKIFQIFGSGNLIFVFILLKNVRILN